MLLSSLVIKVMFIWFILFFIVSQIIVEKKWLPKWILRLHLFRLCLVSAGLIGVAIFLGIFVGQPILLVGTTTILCSSVISWTYRKQYDV